MIKRIILFIFLISLVLGQKRSPAKYWESLEFKEKVAFVNGVYAAGAKFKFHHKQEVKKQFNQDPNWVEPYYIERFYEIIDEYRSEEVGYNLKILALHMDAFYTNSDNLNIPIMEALRVVSLVQDGEQKTANIRLLRAQHKYNK